MLHQGDEGLSRPIKNKALQPALTITRKIKAKYPLFG